VFKSADGGEREMDRQTIIHAHVEAGDAIYHRVAASGGYGDPAARDPALVLQDFEDGKLSAERARDIYKVALDVAARTVDWKSTEALRKAM
jgi:N-methylhydantoinase B